MPKLDLDDLLVFAGVVLVAVGLWLVAGIYAELIWGGGVLVGLGVLRVGGRVQQAVVGRIVQKHLNRWVRSRR